MSELKGKKSKIQINFFNADFLKCSKPKVFLKPHQLTSSSKMQKHQSKHSPLTSTSLYSIEKETKNETTTLLEEDKEKLIQKLNSRISELEFRIKRLENSAPSSHVLSSSSCSTKKVLSNSNSTKDKNSIILKKQIKSSLTNIIKAKRTLSNIKIVNSNNNNNLLSLNKNRNRSYTHSNASKLKQFQTLSVKVSSSSLKRNEQLQTKHNWKSQVNRSIDSNVKSIPKIPKRNTNYSSYTTANYSPVNKKDLLTINNSTSYDEGDVLKLKFDLIKIRTKNLLERVINDKQCDRSNVSSLSNVTPFMEIKKGNFSRNKTFH